MVKVRWKFERGKVYLEVILEHTKYYYWFPKAGLHKRFHLRQIFTRSIHFPAYKDNIIRHYAKDCNWIEGELEDKIVRKKLGILILTEAEYYEQLSKAC